MNKKGLKIIAIFAHPDDGDVKMGATAAMLADFGHHVKFVSLTNGDAGHYALGGGTLAQRRRKEAREAAKQMGIAEYKVMDYHDGELMPELHIRLDVIREIRKWNADVVFGLRPWDYHPDHRYAGMLVQDAAYLVGVANVASDTPPLKKNPVFFYMQDDFKKPYPFEHDVVIGVDSHIECKIEALNAHESQMYEWLPWIEDKLDDIPVSSEERKEWLSSFELVDSKDRKPTGKYLEGLIRGYGKEQAKTFRYFESFEICEYGREPTSEEILNIFPMLTRNEFSRN